MAISGSGSGSGSIGSVYPLPNQWCSSKVLRDVTHAKVNAETYSKTFNPLKSTAASKTPSLGTYHPKPPADLAVCAMARVTLPAQTLSLYAVAQPAAYAARAATAKTASVVVMPKAYPLHASAHQQTVAASVVMPSAAKTNQTFKAIKSILKPTLTSKVSVSGSAAAPVVSAPKPLKLVRWAETHSSIFVDGASAVKSKTPTIASETSQMRYLKHKRKKPVRGFSVFQDLRAPNLRSLKTKTVTQLPVATQSQAQASGSGSAIAKSSRVYSEVQSQSPVVLPTLVFNPSYLKHKRKEPVGGFSVSQDLRAPSFRSLKTDMAIDLTATARSQATSARVPLLAMDIVKQTAVSSKSGASGSGSGSATSHGSSVGAVKYWITTAAMLDGFIRAKPLTPLGMGCAHLLPVEKFNRLLGQYTSCEKPWENLAILEEACEIYPHPFNKEVYFKEILRLIRVAFSRRDFEVALMCLNWIKQKEQPPYNFIGQLRLKQGIERCNREIAMQSAAKRL
jgi:hypothetical protein